VSRHPETVSDAAPSASGVAIGEDPGSPVRGLGLLDADELVKGVSKRRGRVAFWAAFGWVGLVVFVAVFTDFLPLRSHNVLVVDLQPRVAPRWSFTEPFGTDSIGRSVASRLAYGARQSLIIGVCATAIAMSVGTTIGIAAGYFRGKLDTLVGVLIDTVLAMPGLVLLLAIASVGRRSVETVVISLGVVGTPTFIRLARANTLSRAERENIMAARAMGARHGRIIFRELLPDVVLPVSTYAFLVLAVFIVTEATLSFLGLGVPPPTPSWGGMVNDSRPYLESDPLLVFIPSLCILFTVLSFTVLGDHARRRFDVGQSALA
jgi:peptide/nickel transport system permease protein